MSYESWTPLSYSLHGRDLPAWDLALLLVLAGYLTHDVIAMLQFLGANRNVGALPIIVVYREHDIGIALSSFPNHVAWSPRDWPASSVPNGQRERLQSGRRLSVAAGSSAVAMSTASTPPSGGVQHA